MELDPDASPTSGDGGTPVPGEGDGTPGPRDGDGDGNLGDLEIDAAGTPGPAGRLEVSGDSVAIAAGAAIGADGFTDGATIQVILDISGSMQDPLEGSTRIDIAKRVLTQLVTADLPPGTPLMMRTYGLAGNACDTNLTVPLNPLDPGAMTTRIDGVQAVNEYTPLAESIRDATEDMRAIDGPKIVVLLTDGLETCDGDPKAAVRSLVRAVPDAHLNIIGFGIDDPAFKKDMRLWAKIGKGSYFDATDEESLGRAVQAAVKPPFQVLDDDGKEVASGTVGGSAVELPPGRYRVVILMDGNPTIEGVKVRSRKTTRVDLADAATPTPDG